MSVRTQTVVSDKHQKAEKEILSFVKLPEDTGDPQYVLEPFKSTKILQKPVRTGCSILSLKNDLFYVPL